MVRDDLFPKNYRRGVSTCHIGRLTCASCRLFYDHSCWRLVFILCHSSILGSHCILFIFILISARRASRPRVCDWPNKIPAFHLEIRTLTVSERKLWRHNLPNPLRGAVSRFNGRLLHGVESDLLPLRGNTLWLYLSFDLAMIVDSLVTIVSIFD